MRTAAERGRPWTPILAASAASLSVARCFTCAASSLSLPSLRSGCASLGARGARSAGRAAAQQQFSGGAAAVGTAGALAAFAHVARACRRQPRGVPRKASLEPAPEEAEAAEAGAAAAEAEAAPAEPKADKKRSPFAPRKGPRAFDPRKEIGATEPLGFWDPVGICPKDETVFNEYRACELKHGRVAMMAALGAVAQHYVRFPGFSFTNFGKPLPSGLGAVTETPGAFGFVVLLGASGLLEFFFWKDGVDVQKGRWTKEPGNFGDPLGLGQYTEDMRNRELNNGRFAMFAALGIIVAELATGKDAVQQLGL